jgi:hypothetical protein
MGDELPDGKRQPNGVFEFYEQQYGISADEMRSGCRTWFIIFGIASAVLAVAVYSIWKQLS